MKERFPEELKAIFFDMDGVLLDSERVWRDEYGDAFWNDIGVKELPPALSEQIYGISMHDEHAILQREIGLSLTLDEYIAKYDKYSDLVYSSAKLAENLEETLSHCKETGLYIAIVTSSVGNWVEKVLRRLSKDYFDLVVAVPDHPELKPKPQPDPYLYTLQRSGFRANQVIAVEDSNRGIQAAVTAGIYTIASAEFVNEEYKQKGYDARISFLKSITKFFNRR